MPSTRPPLAGHNSTISALYLIANQIRQLIGVTVGVEISRIDGPEMPSDRIAMILRKRSLSMTDDALGTR